MEVIGQWRSDRKITTPRDLDDWVLINEDLGQTEGSYVRLTERRQPDIVTRIDIRGVLEWWIWRYGCKVTNVENFQES